MTIEVKDNPMDVVHALAAASLENNQATIAKCNSLLDAHEQKNQQLIKTLEAEKSARENLELKFQTLEADVRRGGNGGKMEAKKAELQALESFLTKGYSRKGFYSFEQSPEAKALRSDIDIAGGYLAPSEFYNEIIKNLTFISPIRSIARVLQTSRKEIEFPKRTANLNAYWVGQAGTGTVSQQTYGSEKIICHKLTAFVDVSVEMSGDAAFDMVQQVQSDIIEQVAVKEGESFVKGAAANQPEGFLTNALVEEVNSAGSVLTPDSLFDVQKKGIRNGYFVMNTSTLNAIRKFKSTANEYLFQAGIEGVAPSMIAGRPYILAEDMPDIGVGAFPVAYGDFRTGYYIVDNVNLTFREDNLTQALDGLNRYIAYKRVGGKVVQPEVIKKIKITS